MRHLTLFIQIMVNIIGGGYAAALLGLLLLHFLGRDHRWWIAFLINFMPFYFMPLIVLVAGALLAHARFALVVTVPLALLGLVAYGPLFFPKPTGSASGSTLSIITFNVSDKNQHQDRVIAWLREQHADVVLLQEVASDWFGSIQSQLQDLYPYQDQQFTERGSRSNLTLSRFPITGSPTNPIPSVPIRALSLDVEGQPISFYNVSLATPVDAAPRRDLPFEYPFLDLILRYDDTLRNFQIKRLLALTTSETGPYLVAGDFNMSDQTSIYTTLANQMGDSFREAGIGLGMTWPAFQVVGLDAALPALIRIDYVWHSREFQVLSAAVGPYVGSDHLPVKVTFQSVAPSGENSGNNQAS